MIAKTFKGSAVMRLCLAPILPLFLLCAVWPHSAAAHTGHQQIPAEKLPEILKQLAEGDPAQKAHAAEQISLIFPLEAAEPGVAPLGQALASSDPALQGQAARSLGVLAPMAESELPKLAELLSSSDTNVRRAAAWAISMHSPVSAGICETLSALLADSDKNVRFFAAEALLKSEKPQFAAKGVVPTALLLNEQLVLFEEGFQGERTAKLAAATFQAIDPGIARQELQAAAEKQQLRSEFIKAGNSKDVVLQEAGIRGLLWLAAKDPQTVETLSNVLQTTTADDPGTIGLQFMALKALGQIGPAAASALPEIDKRIAGENPMLKRTATRTKELIAVSD